MPNPLCVPAFFQLPPSLNQTHPTKHPFNEHHQSKIPRGHQRHCAGRFHPPPHGFRDRCSAHRRHHRLPGKPHLQLGGWPVISVLGSTTVARAAFLSFDVTYILPANTKPEDVSLDGNPGIPIRAVDLPVGYSQAVGAVAFSTWSGDPNPNNRQHRYAMSTPLTIWRNDVPFGTYMPPVPPPTLPPGESLTANVVITFGGPPNPGPDPQPPTLPTETGTEDKQTGGDGGRAMQPFVAE